MPDNSLNLVNKKSVLFVYRTDGANCHRRTLYDKLNGHSVIRIKKTEFGETKNKTYRYAGLDHHRIMRNVILVDLKNVAVVEELFNKFEVPFIKCPSPVFVRWDFSP